MSFDENQDPMALNNEVGEETNQSVTPTDEEQTSQDESQNQDLQPEQSEDSEGKKGLSNRVRELANKAKTEKQRADSLAAKLEALTGGNTQQYDQPTPQYNLDNFVNPNEELTSDELNKRMRDWTQKTLATAQAQAQILTSQNRVVEQINKEARSVVKKYSQLNPESDDFNPKLSGAITKATEAYVRSNPNASVKKFVDEMMEPYQNSIQKAVGDQQQEIVKQVSQTALRPTLVKQSEKSVKDMSIKEMEDRFGVVY
jgi:hypothetical protein